MYRYINYENLKGKIVAEKNGVLLKKLRKCIIFYTEDSLIRISYGTCCETRRAKLITFEQALTMLELCRKYFPRLEGKLLDILSRGDEQYRTWLVSKLSN